MTIPPAEQVAQVVTSYDTRAQYLMTIVNAICTAIAARAASCTVSVAAAVGSTTLPLILELRQKGYQVTQSGTNLTIAWA